MKKKGGAVKTLIAAAEPPRPDPVGQVVWSTTVPAQTTPNVTVSWTTTTRPISTR